MLVATTMTFARCSQPMCSTRWTIGVVLAALVLLASCGSDLDTAANDTAPMSEVVAATAEPLATEVPATTAPATAEPATVGSASGGLIDADCSTAVAAVLEQDQATARRLADRYLGRSDRCPSAPVVQELLYIWEQNRDYWTDFPAQEQRFFEANVGINRHGVRPEFIGLSVDGASAKLTEDADFPLVQDSGPTVVDDMTMYEFSGGLSVLLVVTREDVVDSVYLFDQT